MERKIPCTYMRGGTSKGCFFLASDLPENTGERDEWLLKIYGSPDAKQINGMGGATPTTSKAAIIRKSDRPDADIDYLFCQIGIDTSMVDISMNCGNISSAVGPYAVDQKLVEAKEPVTEVRIYNVNTGKIILARVPVRNGKFEPEGSYAIDGVPGLASRIDLVFQKPQGAVTGKVLPTGNPLDFLEIGGERIAYSFVDAANPIVFIRGDSLGLKGTETPAQYEALGNIRDIKQKIEIIRGTCAVTAGLAQKPGDNPVLPKVSICSGPETYSGSDGRLVRKEDADIMARFITLNGKMNPSFAGTAGVCTAVAANIPGTIVHEIVCAGQGRREKFEIIRISHPCGIMEIGTEFAKNQSGSPEIESCILGRTARKIMDGFVYICTDYPQ
ncbi:MAG: 3-methylitaconate isomerase [Lachnospiraceae bacterium]|nr:3-methylitaconate isomerase [Lachnospiraceae bacterium]